MLALAVENLTSPVESRGAKACTAQLSLHCDFTVWSKLTVQRKYLTSKYQMYD